MVDNSISSFAKKPERLVIIVTGLSGAGKNVVVRALEDLGFYCVDNLPVPLISTFLKFVFHSNANLLRVALGVDARGEQFLSDFINEIDFLKKQSMYLCRFKIIFLQSSDNVLLKRFQETRRRHPLAIDTSVASAIEKEKSLLAPIKDLADIVFDTDKCNIHELRKWVRDAFSENLTRNIMVNLVSFGFKFGVPAESNIVCDLRFLPNPYFISELKNKDGREVEVQEYLFTKSSVKEYWQQLTNFLEYSISKYYEEGRFFVSIAIGCTGGKHRSVAFVERLSVQKWKNVSFIVDHRDVSKEENQEK